MVSVFYFQIIFGAKHELFLLVFDFNFFVYFWFVFYRINKITPIFDRTEHASTVPNLILNLLNMNKIYIVSIFSFTEFRIVILVYILMRTAQTRINTYTETHTQNAEQNQIQSNLISFLFSFRFVVTRFCVGWSEHL